MRRGWLARIGAVLWMVVWAAQAGAQTDDKVKLGVFPYVTPVQLAKFHNPLRDKFEDVLGRPVALVTAPSFPEFIRRTRDGAYDYVLTAPHLARLAEFRDGYHPLIKTGHVVRGVYLVPKDSPIRDLADIRGHSIMMVGKAAIITQMVIRQLDELGLRDGENIEIRYTRTHNNAMYASLRGEADVSVTGILLYQRINLDDRERVRVIGETPAQPGFILLAHDRVPAAQREQMRDALLRFAESPEGERYLDPPGFKALLRVTEAEMEGLQPYIQRFLDTDR